MRPSVLALCTLLTAGAAFAITKGDPLYIRSRNTRLVDKPNGRVLATLQPGEEVRWEGTVAGVPGWHQVTTKAGKKGALLTANLANRPPQMELRASAGGKPVDQATFLSSGAATKALAPTAAAYGSGKAELKDAVVELQSLEALSDAVTLDDVARHTKTSGLPGAVGGER